MSREATIAFPTYSHLNELFVFRYSKTGTAKGQPVKNGHKSFRKKEFNCLFDIHLTRQI